MLNETGLQVYREARREGMPPSVGVYVARPPVIALEWLEHYQVSNVWADFEYAGRRFRVDSEDPSHFDGSCLSCMEMVEAFRKGDTGIAWLTPDEYDRTVHRVLSVRELDAAGEAFPDGFAASLWGVCGRQDTPTQVRLDERYVAETVRDLADEVIGAEAVAEEAAVIAQRLALFGV